MRHVCLKDLVLVSLSFAFISSFFFQMMIINILVYDQQWLSSAQASLKTLVKKKTTPDVFTTVFPQHQPWLYSHKQPLSCKFCAISSLNIPGDTHLILTSSVQLTKCRLENKWQTPKQINYVSTKLLARVHRAGAGNKSWAHAAIWPVWERTSSGGVQWYTP